MMTMAARDAKRAMWLKHWQEWPGSGERFAEYARRHDLNADEGYRWKRILQRAGLLPQQLTGAGDQATKKSKPAVLRFARVRIESARHAEVSGPLRLQVVLTNGRRADLVLDQEGHLPRILKLLEQPA